tara:strand:+ start:42 stop:551 length:510 start_codon:yes stop_codon:yes gene_type:complete
MTDPVTFVLIASAVVGTVSSIKQAELAKKQASLQQAQYEDNKKIAVEQANIDVKNATLENEFLLGSNLSLASRTGIHAYSSGSFLANRAYNTRVLNDTLYQIDLNKNAKITQANIGISQAGLSARYAVWGAAGNVAGTLANTNYKLHQLDTSGKATIQSGGATGGKATV